MGGTPRTLYWLDATDTNDQFGGASSRTTTEASSIPATNNRY
jgi:hypothetical protein